MEDRCVTCGEIIPEGRQVCPTCERGGICEANGVVIEALEKQIPKKVNVCYQAKTIKPVGFDCPCCGRSVIGSGFYCWHCGQHLDWSDGK